MKRWNLFKTIIGLGVVAKDLKVPQEVPLNEVSKEEILNLPPLEGPASNTVASWYSFPTPKFTIREL